MRKLRIAYNNSLRRLLGIPKYNSASEMFVQLNITGFVRGLTKSDKVLYLFLKNKTSYKVLYFIEGLTFLRSLIFMSYFGSALSVC